MNLSTVIKKTIVTEKSSMAGQKNSYVFAVDKLATKGQIRAAVESVFGVKVKEINTITKRGKSKRNARTRKIAVAADIKKAIVTLVEGEQINATESLSEPATKAKKKVKNE